MWKERRKAGGIRVSWFQFHCIALYTLVVNVSVMAVQGVDFRQTTVDFSTRKRTTLFSLTNEEPESRDQLLNSRSLALTLAT